MKSREVEEVALEEKVAACTVGVTCDGGASWGTGVACVLEGVRWIITAKHNIRNCSLSRLQFAFYMGRLVRSQPGQLDKPFAKLRLAQSVKIAGRRVSSEYDLALLEIEDEARLPDGASFDELSFAKPAPSEKILILGYQWGEFARTPGGVPIASTASNWTTVELEVPPSISRVDSDDYFLARQHSGDAGGYSGAGAWRETQTDSGVWVSRPHLVGMAVAAFPNHSLVQLIRGDALLREISGLTGCG